jgi:hypothetical protein
MHISHLVSKTAFMNIFLLIYKRFTLFFFFLGYVAKDKSFYASLHAEPASRDQDASIYTEFSLQKDQGSLQTEGVINSEYRFVTFQLYFHSLFSLLKKNFILSCREPNNKVEEIDTSNFTLFLEEIQEDYLNSGLQLRTALNKVVERYQAAKLVSIPRLTSYLYDIGSHVDPTVRIRNGPMIRVQVESVKRRKTEGSGRKRKLPTMKNKENLDPQTIPSRKTRKVGKKEHNLSKNIGKNQPN